MYVCGLSSVAGSPPRRPSATSPWNFFRNAGRPARSQSSSSTTKPRLCRVPAYFSPGLPSPTTSTSLLLGLLVAGLVASLVPGLVASLVAGLVASRGSGASGSGHGGSRRRLFFRRLLLGH